MHRSDKVAKAKSSAKFAKENRNARNFSFLENSRNFVQNYVKLIQKAGI